MEQDPRDAGNVNSADEAAADETDAIQEDDDSCPMAEEPPPQRTPFLGEIVSRRSWPLIAIVFVFGLFLAAVPFLFQAERSPFTDALSLYDRLCTARGTPSPTDLSAAAHAMPPDRLAATLSALPCVARSNYRPRMDPVEGRQFGTNRAFVVTMERRTEAATNLPDMVRFMVEEEGGEIRWSPMPTQAR